MLIDKWGPGSECSWANLCGLWGHLGPAAPKVPVSPPRNSTTIYVGLGSTGVQRKEHWTASSQSLALAQPLGGSVSLVKSLSLSGPQSHWL